MRFDNKYLSLNCGKTLLSFISEFISPQMALSNNINEITHELNEFLNVIYHIFNPKNKYTLSNYKIRGQYLLAFSQIYNYLVLNKNCKETAKNLIGLEKSWTKYLCTTKKQIRPLVHLYKTLAILGLIYSNCYHDIFYIKDNSNSGNEPKWLKSLESILENSYNPKLRFSKTKSALCLEKLEPTMVTKINKYLYASFAIRQKYLDQEYCGSIINKDSDIEHENFIVQIQTLLDALNKYRKQHF